MKKSVYYYCQFIGCNTYQLGLIKALFVDKDINYTLKLLSVIKSEFDTSNAIIHVDRAALKEMITDWNLSEEDIDILNMIINMQIVELELYASIKKQIIEKEANKIKKEIYDIAKEKDLFNIMIDYRKKYSMTNKEDYKKISVAIANILLDYSVNKDYLIVADIISKKSNIDNKDYKKTSELIKKIFGK